MRMVVLRLTEYLGKLKIVGKGEYQTRLNT